MKTFALLVTAGSTASATTAVAPLRGMLHDDGPPHHWLARRLMPAVAQHHRKKCKACCACHFFSFEDKETAAASVRASKYTTDTTALECRVGGCDETDEAGSTTRFFCWDATHSDEKHKWGKACDAGSCASDACKYVDSSAAETKDCLPELQKPGGGTEGCYTKDDADPDGARADDKQPDGAQP